MILKGIFKVTNLFAKYLIISVLLQYPVSYIELGYVSKIISYCLF